MINNIEEYKKTLDEYKSIVGPTSESNEIKQDLIDYVEQLETTNKKISMESIRKWFEGKYNNFEKGDVETEQDVCDIIWFWEKYREART